MDGLGVIRVGQASVGLGPHLDEGWGLRDVKPVWTIQWNIFAGCSRVVLLLWVVCVVCVLCLSALASVHCCHLVTLRERADLLALACDVYCDFVTCPCWL